MTRIGRIGTDFLFERLFLSVLIRPIRVIRKPGYSYHLSILFMYFFPIIVGLFAV